MLAKNVSEGVIPKARVFSGGPRDFPWHELKGDTNGSKASWDPEFP
jgi:hypothetical protein